MDHGQGSVAADGPALNLTRRDIARRLGEVPLFQGLGDQDLSEILDMANAVRVRANEYVFEEGDRADHLFVVVHGAVELRKATGQGLRRLGLMQAGQAFGETELLNRTPRAMSALALDDSYLLSVSQAAFSRLLGGDTMAVRLLRNLSTALWAASVRGSSAAPAPLPIDDGHETLSEFNRVMRARLLPRVTPRVSGYDVAATTLAPPKGSGCTTWDWFVLSDGRPAFAVIRAVRSDSYAAQRLAAVRLLLRGFAGERQTSLGDLLGRVDRSLRAGWVDGISGPVSVGLVALSDGAVEWVEAGPVTSLLLRGSGVIESRGAEAAPLGNDGERVYESDMLVLGSGDRLIALTDDLPDARDRISEILPDGPFPGARDALTGLLAGIGAERGVAPGPPDVSAALIIRTTPAR